MLKYLNDELNKQEKFKFEEWLAAAPENQVKFEQYIDKESWDAIFSFERISTDEEWNKFEKQIIDNKCRLLSVIKNDPVPKKKIKYLFHAQAIFIVLIFISLYSYLFHSSSNRFRDGNATIVKSMVSNNITLQLADGRRISLDSTSNIRLPDQGNYQLVLKGNVLRYLPGYFAFPNADSGIINYISVPNGKHFEVELPDGSKLWLNAASSIRFHVGSSKRTVEMTGEVYFEVRPIFEDRSKIPFIVNVLAPGLKQVVTVFGTAFNINAYCDAPFIKTTLFEGCVSVNSMGKSMQLQPGEQLKVGKSRLSVSRKIAKEAIAWKENNFLFFDEPVHNVLNEIGRWYGYHIEFETDTSYRITMMAPRSYAFDDLLAVVFYKKNYLIQKKGDLVRITNQ